MTRLPLSKAMVQAAGSRRDVQMPPPALLDLPERVVQFGTGAFLRGFIEFFIDEANRKGMFAGRIVAVGSTRSGREMPLKAQDGLYTLVTRGLVDGERREELRVIGSLSRALSAEREWNEVLALVRSPELRLIVSNTTEVGIALDESDAFDASPPRSFPAKLARLLAERGKTFAHDPARGVLVMPCELIERNGDRLREIVLAHARRWHLDPAFTRWVDESVHFCNTLVDRIVPGTPTGADAAALRGALGYDDALTTAAEPYRLLAIERPASAAGAEALRLIGFTGADPGIVVADDIRPYRERKVRLLNGTHTITVPLALLHGCETVHDAVEHDTVGPFMRRVLLDELVQTTDAPGAEPFAHEVLARFANPYIRHALIDITLQQTAKMRVRIVPAIVRYGALARRAPPLLSFGFAAYLLFMRGDLQAKRGEAGLAIPTDDQGGALRDHWRRVANESLERLVDRACGDESLWGTDLRQTRGFSDAVTECLTRMVRDGVPSALAAQLAEVVA